MQTMKPDLDFFEPHQRLKIKRSFDPAGVERILVIGINQLGGLMFSTPFFRELRKAFPEAHIVNLVGGLNFGLMQNCPYVDEVWLWDKSKTWETVQNIRDEKFDLAFLANGTLRTALMAYLAGIPNRIGYDKDGIGYLLTVQLHLEFHSRYRPENLFDMLRAIGFSPRGVYDREVWVSEQNVQYAKQWFEEHKPINNQKILAFNPFSTDSKRRWTDEGWRELLKGIKPLEIEAVMLVGPNEIEEGQKLLKAWGVDKVAVESHSLTNLAGILHHIDYVVGPDSGFIHMALAVKKPHVIGLFNVVPPKSCFPDDARHVALIEDTLPCCPCYLYKAKDQCPNDLRCMKQLDAKRVLSAIEGFQKSI
ncbi:glycosyltransferase family 9 protein [Thiomicrorhabdus sp. ZW0627]|uniref:glycosyltransferase family 9 protein n=1 Tax=Thiomicrorhabdus sp. ZW0627 TaxID=3039774 RepID=UPI00243723BD|nr:glycosyltransferase family 9 protein [Thiomicrorhabdus sp. ZW0627]MDG6774934.1 glycosyltransferase family 9 protein [Thiomicrorhabdus sp. ZW0627]